MSKLEDLRIQTDSLKWELNWLETENARLQEDNPDGARQIDVTAEQRELSGKRKRGYSWTARRRYRRLEPLNRGPTQELQDSATQAMQAALLGVGSDLHAQKDPEYPLSSSP